MRKRHWGTIKVTFTYCMYICTYVCTVYIWCDLRYSKLSSLFDVIICGIPVPYSALARLLLYHLSMWLAISHVSLHWVIYVCTYICTSQPNIWMKYRVYYCRCQLPRHFKDIRRCMHFAFHYSTCSYVDMYHSIPFYNAYSFECLNDCGQNVGRWLYWSKAANVKLCQT